MRKAATVILIVCAGAAVCIFILFVNDWYIRLLDRERTSVDWLVGWLKLFIAENEGRFPSSQQELIDKGLLKVEPHAGGYNYRVYMGGNDKGGAVFPLFERFSIRYGTNVDDLEIRNATLFDKLTHKEVLLVQGFYPQLKQTYTVASVQLYYEMLGLQKQRRQLLPYLEKKAE